MKTTTYPSRRVKPHFRSFTAVTAYALERAEEQNERRTRFFAPEPDAHGEVPRVHCFMPAGCCAYTEAGNICGVTPAKHFDLKRGGMVCEAHKPKEGGAV